MSSLQNHYHYKLDFQKLDQHTEGKWIIYSTKHHRDIQFQSLEQHCKHPRRECKQDTKESEGNMFSPIFKRMSRAETSAHLQNQNYLVTASLNV